MQACQLSQVYCLTISVQFHGLTPRYKLISPAAVRTSANECRSNGCKCLQKRKKKEVAKFFEEGCFM